MLVPLLLVGRSAWATDLEVVGTDRLGAAGVREVVGEPPDGATDDELEAWAGAALREIEAHYAMQGYPKVRGWTSVDERGVHIEIDEGIIDRTVFRGANLLQNVLFSESLTLTEKVAYAPTIDEQLALLVKAKGLLGAEWDLVEGDAWKESRISGLVHERMLVVSLGTKEQDGWGFDVQTDPLFGFVGTLSWARHGLAGTNDYLRPFVSVAMPLQEYVFEQDARFRWVYGSFGLRYRAPTLGTSRWAPDSVGFVNLRQYPRVDLGVLQMMVFETQGFFGFTFRSQTFTQSLGAMVQYAMVPDTDILPAADPTPVEDRTGAAFRLGFAGTSQAEWSVGMLRTDLRDRVEANYVIAWDFLATPIIKMEAKAQFVTTVKKRAIFLFRLRGALVLGDVNLYDEIRVAGKYQRTYFADVYWSRMLAQGEIAVRYPVHPAIMIGLFYDHSLFDDRTDPYAPVAAGADSFGPSLHFLTFGGLAIDAYAAMGFAPPTYRQFSRNTSRFSSTIGLQLGTVY